MKSDQDPYKTNYVNKLYPLLSYYCSPSSLSTIVIVIIQSCEDTLRPEIGPIARMIVSFASKISSSTIKIGTGELLVTPGKKLTNGPES